MTIKPSYNILGIGVDGLSLSAGLAAAQAMAAPDAPAAYVALPYVEFMTKAVADPSVAKVINTADQRLPNGVALNWAIEYLYGGQPGLGRLVTTLAQIVFNPQKIHQLAPARFDSANFTWPLLEWAAQHQRSLYLIGSPKQLSIEQTAKHLQSVIAGLNVVGIYPGYFNKAAEIRLVQELKTLRPDIILVGIGFPQQELLMHQLKSELSHGLMIGEGGSFDYAQYGGHIKRSPAWLRRIGLEWLWRLLQEPSRLRRQTAIPKFIYLVYMQGRSQGS